MAAAVAHLISTHGYWVVALIVALESMGVPLPGETTLVTAGIYAGTTHRLSIAFVILAAAVGAMVGDSVGYWIGRRVGYSVLLRYGSWVRLTPERLMLGQHLFQAHGGKVVFFGRFVALLRTLAALLAGTHRMPWRRFLIFNVSGGVTWATVFGVSSFVLGERIEAIRGPLSWAAMGLGCAAAAAGWWFIRRGERALTLTTVDGARTLSNRVGDGPP